MTLYLLWKSLYWNIICRQKNGAKHGMIVGKKYLDNYHKAFEEGGIQTFQTIMDLIDQNATKK